MGYNGLKLHPVAGKCGVFAETDINGLQKMGVPPDELMASLFEAIVMQNLSVLTRGNTLRPVVLLLGGPNCYIAGMRECWKPNIPKIWEERNTPLPEGVPPEDLIRTPDNAQYFAAIGAVEFGKTEDDCVGHYTGWRASWSGTSNVGREEEKAQARAAEAGWPRTTRNWRRSRPSTGTRSSRRRTFQPGEVVEGFVGLDGGSTSTKAVLSRKTRAPHSGQVLPALEGQPDRGHDRDPAEARRPGRGQGAELKVLGVGTTGYAKDILKDVVGADAALVETVAHTEAGLHFYDDVDVICDVGGQDIKIIILQERPRERFQAEHAVLGGQRLLPAIHRAGLQRAGGAVRRHGLRRQGLPVVRLRLRGVHAVATSSTSSGRAGSRKRSWPACATCCRRTSGCTSRRFRTSRPSARASCCRAARSTTWRR